MAQIEADLLELYTVPVDLAELVAVAVEDARAAATEKRVAITLDSDDSLPLEADAARLRQVLDNLVSNAIKYTPAGGAISVTTSDSEGQRCVEVADNGIGVPHDELGRLFSRFYPASGHPMCHSRHRARARHRARDRRGPRGRHLPREPGRRGDPCHGDAPASSVRRRYVPVTEAAHGLDWLPAAAVLAQLLPQVRHVELDLVT